jgi:glycosyl transferase family 25
MQLYFINLAHRPDRRAEIEAEFARLGLDATRIEALTPADIPEATRRHYCDPRRRFWLTEPELACSLSHIAACEAILASGAPFGAIFEDDVKLSDSLPAFLAAFDAAPPSVDVLRLEADPDPMRVASAKATGLGPVLLQRVHSWSSGAAAYILSRRAAQRVLDSGAMLERQTDRVLFNPYEPFLRGLAMRHADPALAIQRDRLPGESAIASDLGASRSGRSEAERAVFPRRVWHDVREGIDRDIRIGLLKAWHQYASGARKRLIAFAPE